MKQVRKPPRLHGSLLNVLLLLFVAVLLVVGVFLVRVKLLQNAQSLGMALVHSYAVEEELNITSLETNLTMASQFVDDIINDGGDPADIQNWLAGYFSKLTDIIGEGMVDFYAVIDGEIVAVNPWEEDDTYPYESTEWYRMAVAAEGLDNVSVYIEDEGWLARSVEELAVALECSEDDIEARFEQIMQVQPSDN